MTLYLFLVQLEHCRDGCRQVVALWCHGVVQSDRVLSTLDVEDLGPTEVGGELLTRESGGHDNHLEPATLLPRSGCLCRLDNAKQKVCVDGSLVCLIQNDNVVPGMNDRVEK